jgi:serine/threonine protein kinase
LISDKLINQDTIDLVRYKYVPPEALLFLVEDISHDIWSFGCILIDLFSKEQPIFKQNLNFNELQKLYDNNLFPVIPNDVNGILRDIISKCLERNYQERITINELSENLNIVLDVLASSKKIFIYFR